MFWDFRNGGLACPLVSLYCMNDHNPKPIKAKAYVAILWFSCYDVQIFCLWEEEELASQLSGYKNDSTSFVYNFHDKMEEYLGLFLRECY